MPIIVRYLAVGFDSFGRSSQLKSGTVTGSPLNSLGFVSLAQVG